MSLSAPGNMNCLFCRSNGPFNTIEHIIPEALGNDDLVISGHVCDACQSYLGKEIERFVLSETPIGFWRVHLAMRGKKGKLPTVDLSVPTEPKGVLPQWSKYHDSKVGFAAHKDGTSSVIIEDPEMLEEVLSGKRTEFRFVFSPKHLVQIGRFLGKIAIELLCKEDPVLARHSRFDELRHYVRYGHRKEIWPIFHAIKGSLEDLVTLRKAGDEAFEEVLCYEYGVHRSEKYWSFSFRTGLDFWVICMNDRYPTPTIREAYPGVELDLLWYPSESWTPSN